MEKIFRASVFWFNDITRYLAFFESPCGAYYDVIIPKKKPRTTRAG